MSSKRALVNVVLDAGVAISGVASGTCAGEASRSVHAGRSWCTIVSIGVTLVNVPASVATNTGASVARRTDASVTAISASLASCLWIAVGSLAGVDVDRRTLVAVSFVAIAAGTLVLAVVVAKISAVSVDVAVVLTCGALVDLVRLAAVAVAVVAAVTCASVAADSVYAEIISIINKKKGKKCKMRNY